MRKFLSLLLFTVNAFGQVSSNESQYIRDYSLLKNPGLEQGLVGWSVTAGTLARETTNKRSGSAALSWDASASSQELSTTLVTIPLGDGACLAEFYYKGFGTADIHYWVENNSGSVIGGYSSTGDGLNYVISSAASAFTRSVAITFSCPTSGTVQLVLQAQGDAAIGYVDDAYLGRDYRVGSGVIETPWAQFTATVTGSSANPGAVTSDIWWRRIGTDMLIQGYITVGTVSPGSGSIQLEIPESLNINSTVAASTAARAVLGSYNTFNDPEHGNVSRSTETDLLYFSKQGSSGSFLTFADIDNSDVIQVRARVPISEWADSANTVRGDVSDVSGSLKYAGTASCQWTTTSASMAAFTADTDCPSQTTSGNMTAPATKIPAGIVPRIPTGKYMVIAQGVFRGDESSSGNSSCSFEIYDGTTSGARVVAGDLASKGRDIVSTVSGIFEYSSLQTNKQFQVRAYRITGNGNCDIVNNDVGSDFEIRIIPISQGLPKPFIPGSVFAGRSGVVKIKTAGVTCSSSSSITDDVDGLLSAIGNISVDGECALTFETGYSSAPRCFVSKVTSSGRMIDVRIHTISTSGATLGCVWSSTTSSATTIEPCTSLSHSITCIGDN